jgi:hypothetical protein
MTVLVPRQTSVAPPSHRFQNIEILLTPNPFFDE